MHAVTYEHGLHLMGTPLWFDADRRRELCIVTGIADEPPLHHSRLLTSPAMAEALERLGHGSGVLPTPWQRWVGVGGHRVQLIDAEAAPGCSAALVMAGDAPLLVAGTLRAEPAAWPHAGHVVARMPALRHRGVPLKTVALDVAQRIEAHASRFGTGSGDARLTVWVDSLEVGLALHAALMALRMTLKPLGPLGKIISPAPVMGQRACLALGRADTVCGPGDLRIDSGLGMWSSGGVATGSAGGAEHAGDIGGSEGLGDVSGPGHAQGFIVGKTLAVRWYADLTALQKVLEQSRARRVSLVNVPPSLHAAVRCALGTHVSTQFLSDSRELPLKVSHPAMI